jgi:hypothetical protein
MYSFWHVVSIILLIILGRGKFTARVLVRHSVISFGHTFICKLWCHSWGEEGVGGERSVHFSFKPNLADSWDCRISATECYIVFWPLSKSWTWTDNSSVAGVWSLGTRLCWSARNSQPRPNNHLLVEYIIDTPSLDPSLWHFILIHVWTVKF